MSLVPADSGQRTTAHPRVRPQHHAPAFVNDEARAVARHVSRDVCGARVRAPVQLGRRVTDARIVPAVPRVLATTSSTVARPRARRVPSVTNRASHAAQHPRGHQCGRTTVRTDRRHLPHAQDNTAGAAGTPIPTAQWSGVGDYTATCHTPRRVGIPSERACGFRLRRHRP